jgi:hypothetical protein
MAGNVVYVTNAALQEREKTAYFEKRIKTT